MNKYLKNIKKNTNMEHLSLNHAISKIGTKIFEEYWKIFIGFNNDKIISLGSGIGTIEYYLQETYKHNIICVDPDPDSFQKRLSDESGIDPQYSTCDQLIEENKDLISNCNLFINWPLPNADGRYDIYAINDLQPKNIFVVCETSGTSGSDMFLHWLKNYIEEIKTFAKDDDFKWTLFSEKDDYFKNIPKYKIIESTAQQLNNGNEVLYHRYIILARKDVYPQKYKRTENIFLSPIYATDNNDCIIS